MKIVALEEHFATPEIMAAWRALSPERQDLALRAPGFEERLFDLGDRRIEHMDAMGVDVQVLSLTTPGTQNLDADAAIALSAQANDVVVEAIRAHPARLQGFATLPTPAPVAAARELERAIKLGLNGAMLHGRTGERNLDHPDFLPIFEAAATLRAPLYLHPQSPSAPVRAAYYDGFSPPLDTIFATAGIGWHFETGIQAVRLVLSGVFDRYPDLQIILGHWGEVVLFYLERLDILSSLPPQIMKLQRPISDYFRNNIHVTPAGIYSQRYLRWAADALGVERILFATDYPYIMSEGNAARAFVEEAELDSAGREAIASGNWDRLCAAIKR